MLVNINHSDENINILQTNNDYLGFAMVTLVFHMGTCVKKVFDVNEVDQYNENKYLVFRAFINTGLF